MRIFLLLVALFLIASFPFVSSWYYGIHKDDYTNSQIEGVIENYLMNHPEKILESVEKYQMKQIALEQQQRLENSKTAIKQNREQLADQSYPSFGSKSSETIVVEFFDATCGYCKQSANMLKEMAEKYPNVTYVLRNLPTMREGSNLAAKYDLGFWLFTQQKSMPSSSYMDFYLSIMKNPNGEIKESFLNDAVEKSKVNVQEFKKFLKEKSEKIEKMINDTVNLSSKLQIQGTPAFVVGEEIVLGASQNALSDAIERTLKK